MRIFVKHALQFVLLLGCCLEVSNGIDIIPNEKARERKTMGFYSAEDINDRNINNGKYDCAIDKISSGRLVLNGSANGFTTSSSANFRVQADESKY